ARTASAPPPPPDRRGRAPRAWRCPASAAGAAARAAPRRGRCGTAAAARGLGSGWGCRSWLLRAMRPVDGVDTVRIRTLHPAGVSGVSAWVSAGHVPLRGLAEQRVQRLELPLVAAPALHRARVQRLAHLLVGRGVDDALAAVELR